MILLNEQTNNKLYTSKEYVNAKQIMLSRCVAIKIAVVISPGTGSVVNCKLLFAGRKSITFSYLQRGGGGIDSRHQCHVCCSSMCFLYIFLEDRWQENKYIINIFRCYFTVCVMHQSVLKRFVYEKCFVYIYRDVN